MPLATDRLRVPITRLRSIAYTATVWLLSSACTLAGHPNILVILADDVGYGDLACYNPDAKVATPRLDALATEGMRFTDAHSPATVCTPSRFSIMTGAMCFRSGKTTVFTGIGGPCLIAPERLTLPELLRDAGYTTAMHGKWHIGLTFFDTDGAPIREGGVDAVRRVDFTRRIEGGPLDHGFDRFFGTACCPTTDWLYAFIEGDHIPTPPTHRIDPATLPKNPYTGDCRLGLIAPDFEMDRVDLVFVDKSKKFLRDHVRERPEQPFFLFHSMQAVHLPSLPAKEFQGRSGAGPHGDFIEEMDWIVGDLMATLDELGVAENTIVIFCSDNGPEVPTVIAMRRDHAHDGARPWRGVKRDQWEGGHRTPLIVRWPARIEPGTISDQLTSLTDLFATCAAIVGEPVPADAAEDSYDMLPVLLGEQGNKPVRPFMLQQTWLHKFAIRKGKWKYLDHKGSAGNDYAREAPWGMKPYALPELDPDASGQLYDLEDDPGETANLSSRYPEIGAELKSLLDESIASGRSAPAFQK